MSGGGTPRQRMINMMYLVLTAMLALQVSSSIIEKFVFLYRSMEQAKNSAEKGSQAALSSLKAKAKKEKGSSKAKQAVTRAEEVVRETAKVNAQIDKIINELKKEAGGGPDEHHVVKNAKEETKVEEMMIAGKKGTELKNILNGHVEWLNKKAKDWKIDLKFDKIALDNKENPIYKNDHDPMSKNKTFSESNFAQTPVIAALAIIVQKQTQLIGFEQKLLSNLGAKDLSNTIKFNKIMAFAAAEANTIAVGQDYKAQLILVASSDKFKPRMTVTAGSLKMDGTIGKVTIPATSAGERSWSGQISLKMADKDTVFKTGTMKYTVVEPVCIFNTKGGFPLYKGCANELQTSVPALGAGYAPQFSVNNGSVVPGSSTGDCTIYPSSLGKCTLNVRSSGTNVGSKNFNVIPVPPPSVFLASSNGNPINLEKPKRFGSSVKLMVIPDKTFKQTLPKEARYQVGRVEVTQYRGSGSIAKKVFNTNTIPMTAFKIRKGDSFSYKVISVKRINSRGAMEDAKVTNKFMSVRAK